MNLPTDEQIAEQYAGLTAHQLPRAGYERIRNHLVTLEAQLASEKNQRRKRSSWKTVTSISSGAAAIAVVGMGFFAYSHHHENSSQGKYDVNTAQANRTTGTAPESTTSFDYSKYIPFQPLLPSDTEGASVASVLVGDNQVQGDEMLQGTSYLQVSYNAPGGKSFIIQENPATGNEPTLPKVDSSVTKVPFGNNQTLYELSYSLPNTNTQNHVVAFISGPTEYLISSQDGYTTDELERVATSIRLPCALTPTHIWLSGTSLEQVEQIVYFTPVLPDQVWTGYQPTVYVATMDSSKRSTVSELDVQYEAPNGSRMIQEMSGKRDWALKEFAKGQKLSIDGQEAYLVNVAFRAGDLMWLNPRTDVLVDIPGAWDDLEQSKQIMQSMIEKSMKP